MPRRAALPSALALALLAAACAPSGDAPGPTAALGPTQAPRQLPSPAPRAHAEEPAPAPASGVLDAECGVIALESDEAWASGGERFAAVRRGWHPRPEHGRPSAIRRARSPVELPGFELWQVQVAGAPRSLQPCFTRQDAPLGPQAWLECMPAWMLVRDTTPEARPRTHEQWAKLLGVLDGASAVYPDEATLDRCVTGLPQAVREAVPPLGLRWIDGAMHATFVERIDVDRKGALLVVANATLDADQFGVAHEELLMLEDGGAR